MNRLKIYLLLLCTLISTTFVYSSKIETLNVGYGANQYTAILQDSNGLMWLGCNRGLFFYDGYQAHPFQLGRYIYSIMQIDNDLLCFTDETGVHLLNTTTEQIVPTVLQQTD